MATSTIRDANPSWQVLVGLFEPEEITREIDRGAPLLVLPNNDRHAETLAQSYRDQSGILQLMSETVLGREDIETNWYRFSDSRYDGTDPLKEVQIFSPNLRLEEIEQRQVMRLDTVIHRWAEHNPGFSDLLCSGAGRLWLQCKLPAPVVAGASRIMEGLGEICWTPIGSLEERHDPKCEAWVQSLEEGLFQPAKRQPLSQHRATISLIWRQDPMQVALQHQQKMQVQLAQLHEERQELVEKLVEQETANLALEARLVTMKTELTNLRNKGHELEALLTEKGNTASSQLSELEALRQEHNELRSAHHELRDDHNRLQQTQDTLVAEKQELLNQLQGLREHGSNAEPQKGDLRVCMNASDADFGTLQMLVSGPGEPQIWQAAVAPSLSDCKMVGADDADGRS